ncbi:MAG: electron transfer flavoprotein subunit beta/FixA family protein [Clostridiales bacterium]
MNIIVCIKQVPDINEVRLNPKTGTLIWDGVPNIINPDDKAGLEAALMLKDQCGAYVTALSLGPLQADLALREALAMGADRAVLVTDRTFSGADTWATSSTLASAIRKIGDYDLIVTGRQAIDGDTAQVGPQIAEHLGLANISYAEELTVDDGYITVKRQYEDRYHMIRAKLPCLIAVLAELGAPRYMTPGGIFDAYRHQDVNVLCRADLDVEDGNIGLKGSPTRVLKSFTKAVKGKGTVVNLDAQESADWLTEKLQEKFII